MKLKFFLKNKKKTYTLKSLSPDKKPTKEAHYKFKKAPTFTRTKTNQMS
jgi:hypothetical protein|tara:strand:- start:37 stop:183 length:147 start_codon:yes stop_codon:yes gene_type:complete